MTPIETLNNYYEAVKKGTIKSMEGLLTLFTLAGEPLSLKQREPMVPVFSLNRPKRMTLLTGRQVSKSFTIAELCAMLTGFTRGFTSAVVEPRFIQKKRFNSQILAPLLRDCLVRDLIIDKKNTDNLDLKQFRAGGQLLLLSGLRTADSARGASGVNLCVSDESLINISMILVYDYTKNTLKSKKIEDIKCGDAVVTFTNRGLDLSFVNQDASYRGYRPVYEIKTESGRTVTATSGHLFPTNIGKKRLYEIVNSIKSSLDGYPPVKIVELFENVPAVDRVRFLDTYEKDEEEFKKLVKSVDFKKNTNICLVTAETRYFAPSYGILSSAPTARNSGMEIVNDAVYSDRFKTDPIISVKYVGDYPVYDLDVIGTHNFILANGICSYNCQDIPNSFLPVFESMTDAMVDTGFRLRSGTAKTSDCALVLSFEESSQGHWCIKCPCGKYNIAAPDQQLFQMIGRHGCSCAYCGRVLDVTTGYYVFKYPSRVYTHIGYHMPQIIFDFHNTKGGWGEILYKKNNWGKTEFLNEVLGVPDDDSVRLLGKGDLLKARNNVRDKATAVRLKSSYDMCVLGVDWGGGGGGDSATGIAVIAKNNNASYFECLYMNRLPQGLTPEQEADAVASLANEFEVDYIAHDYTGAGFVRESLFISKHPGWQPYMYPVSYTYKPTSDLVTVSTSGSRTSYTVDKTKSLLLTINCIKYGALFLPWFDEKDPNAVQLDFLAIIEHHQSLKEDAGGKNTVLRSSEVYLLDKVAGKKDDAAQAVNIGLIAACNIIGYYPVFTFDSKYDMTPEKYEMLTGEKG